MFKSVVALAVMSAISAPAVAQTAPAPQSATAAKPQTVKKTICRRVDDEETTGSRVGEAPKVCKTIEVPAPAGSSGNGQQAPAAANQTGNNF